MAQMLRDLEAEVDWEEKVAKVEKVFLPLVAGFLGSKQGRHEWREAPGRRELRQLESRREDMKGIPELAAP